MSPRGGKRAGAGKPLQGSSPKVRKTYSLDPDLVKWVQELAAKSGRSASEIVEECIRKGKDDG